MFRDNLKEQIEYKDMIIKELAAKTGISKRTIDTYVDNRAVIPNAEIAVKLAKALDTTVEFLVNGKESEKILDFQEEDVRLYKKYKKMISDIEGTSPEVQEILKEMISAACKTAAKSSS